MIRLIMKWVLKISVCHSGLDPESTALFFQRGQSEDIPSKDVVLGDIMEELCS